MNQRQLRQRLSEAADAAGLDPWAIARRTEGSEVQVRLALSSQGPCDLELLVDIADAVGLEVVLQPAAHAVRCPGPIPTVVDLAIARIAPCRDQDRDADG